MCDQPYQWSQLWEGAKNIAWYKWTTFFNHGGDLISWIEAKNEREARLCKALIRREDGLILRNTLSCRACVADEIQRYKHRGYSVGYFFRGTGILGEEYDFGGSRVHRKYI